MLVKCGKCKGIGRVWPEGTTGTYMNKFDVAHDEWAKTCPSCGGSGKIEVHENKCNCDECTRKRH